MNYYNYFTEIEEHFVRRRGKHLLISPMDWSLIASWRDSGVPLHIALRGIDIAMDGFLARARRSGRVSSLFYCHDTVMSEYANYLDSRVGEEGSRPAEQTRDSKEKAERTEGPDKETVLNFLAGRISEIKSLRAKLLEQENALLGEALQRVLSRLEELASELRSQTNTDLESLDRDLGILDQLLVSELRGAVSRELMNEWEDEGKKELKIYRKRLPKETYLKILDNFLRGKIRRHFNVGELSLFHL